MLKGVCHFVVLLSVLSLQFDAGKKGFLMDEELVIALRAINPRLTSSERTFLYRVHNSTVSPIRTHSFLDNKISVMRCIADILVTW